MVACIIVVNNLIHSIYNLWEKKDLITRAKKELDYAKSENNKLKSKLSYAQSNDFVEEEARNKLFWTKKGEESVLIPQELINQGENSSEAIKDSNLQKWWKLFF